MLVFEKKYYDPFFQIESVSEDFPSYSLMQEGSPKTVRFPLNAIITSGRK